MFLHAFKIIRDLMQYKMIRCYVVDYKLLEAKYKWLFEYYRIWFTRIRGVLCKNLAPCLKK